MSNISNISNTLSQVQNTIDTINNANNTLNNTENTVDKVSNVSPDNVKLDKDYYLDCQPTGHSAEEIVAYSVPIDSEYTRDSARIDIYKTLINVCLILIIMIGVYFIVPLTYKYSVIDVINLNYNEEVDVDNPTYKSKEDFNRLRQDRMSAVDIILTIWFLTMFIISILYAIDYGIAWAYICVCIVLIYFMGWSVISQNKPDISFMTTSRNNKKPISVTTSIDVTDNARTISLLRRATNIGMLLLDGVMYIGNMYNQDKNDKTNKHNYAVIIVLCILLAFYYGIIIFIYMVYYDKSQWKDVKVSWEGSYFVILPVFVILPFILQFMLSFGIGTNYERFISKYN